MQASLAFPIEQTNGLPPPLHRISPDRMEMKSVHVGGIVHHGIVTSA
jgi:hypothetical protein